MTPSLKIGSVLTIIVAAVTNCSQEKINNPPATSSVYVLGTNDIGTTYPTIAYWKDGVVTNITDGSTQVKPVAIVVSGSDVYVTGFEGNNFKYWKNGVGFALSGTTLNNNTPTANVYGMTVSGTDVYCSGYLADPAVGSKTVATYWRNGSPFSLTDGSYSAVASSISVIGTDVYVAGSETNGNYSVAKYWKNGIPTTLTSGTSGANAVSITVSGSDVYVAGVEANSGGVLIAKYWKNGVATALTDGITPGDAYSIFISGNDVYVAGYQQEVFQPIAKNIAKYWKNGAATSLSDETTNSYAFSISVTNTKDVYTLLGSNFSVFLLKNGIKVSPFDGFNPKVNAVALFVK